MGMLFYRYLAKKVKYVGLSIKELQHHVEGMNPIQAKLFSRLELNEFLI
jgi:hypothetical protein